jgi:hypothetical protein
MKNTRLTPKLETVEQGVHCLASQTQGFGVSEELETGAYVVKT